MLSAAEDMIRRCAFTLKDMDVFVLVSHIKSSIDTANQERHGVLPEVNHTSLRKYTDKVINIYKQSGQFSMADGFEYAANSLINYSGKSSLLLTDIDEVFLLGYEADCRSKGMKANAFGAYLRSIRRIYNLAIKDSSTEITKAHYPFGQGGYSIKKEKTKKRAIKTDYLKIIRGLDYKYDSPIWHHRNYLLFMFNCRGMNFIYLSFLTSENLDLQQKTGQ
ncbi:phage integrase SAM-like domain-containing protein [Fulvivirga sediminis]|uniref:Phage integrase SAM-like domain-containing protein n=1 Tax=Fulvivirga sediminis TaxID=2803949 RepID=A0A937FBI6_9BACT|nr:phage integrase SAM-like domain-containing protein [Fulvivirga sediminis]MBL3658951.1 phage integrase SAM-like domain-containing protein [Fulvivirga sediminis]